MDLQQAVQDAFPADYIDGFVKQCMDLGLNAQDTEMLFRVHANNTLMADPDVHAGFRAGIQHVENIPGLNKAAMLKYLTPEMLALSMDCQIRYGNDPWSEGVRKAAGLPEPSWDTVPAHVKSAALVLSSMCKKQASQLSPNPLSQFDALPLQQKVLLASLFGGVAGGTARAASPNTDDQIHQRGGVSRFMRGAIRGAITGTGAAAGETAGSAVAGNGSEEGRMLGMAGGALLGGIGGHQALSI